jgi:hypothetical protein
MQNVILEALLCGSPGCDRSVVVSGSSGADGDAWKGEWLFMQALASYRQGQKLGRVLREQSINASLLQHHRRREAAQLLNLAVQQSQVADWVGGLGSDFGEIHCQLRSLIDESREMQSARPSDDTELFGAVMAYALIALEAGRAQSAAAVVDAWCSVDWDTPVDAFWLALLKARLDMAQRRSLEARQQLRDFEKQHAVLVQGNPVLALILWQELAHIELVRHDWAASQEAIEAIRRAVAQLDSVPVYLARRCQGLARTSKLSRTGPTARRPEKRSEAVAQAAVLIAKLFRMMGLAPVFQLH